jgi:hypothetical protein
MIIIIKLIKIENCFSGRKSIVFHGKSDGVPDKIIDHPTKSIKLITPVEKLRILDS